MPLHSSTSIFMIATLVGFRHHVTDRHARFSPGYRLLFAMIRSVVKVPVVEVAELANRSSCDNSVGCALHANKCLTSCGEAVVVVYPLPWPLLVGGVRCSRL